MRLRNIKFFLTLIYLGVLKGGFAQTDTALINRNWKLVYIYHSETKKKLQIDFCSPTLYFKTDSTYLGDVCCNNAHSSYCPTCKVKKTALYETKKNRTIKMTRPMTTSVGCVDKRRTECEDLILESWETAYKYVIKADTLILRCQNKRDLYYIKTK